MPEEQNMPPVHPGEYLKEELLVPMGISANSLALRLGAIGNILLKCIPDFCHLRGIFHGIELISGIKFGNSLEICAGHFRIVAAGFRGGQHQQSGDFLLTVQTALRKERRGDDHGILKLGLMTKTVSLSDFLVKILWRQRRLLLLGRSTGAED